MPFVTQPSSPSPPKSDDRKAPVPSAPETTSLSDEDRWADQMAQTDDSRAEQEAAYRESATFEAPTAAPSPSAPAPAAPTVSREDRLNAFKLRAERLQPVSLIATLEALDAKPLADRPYIWALPSGPQVQVWKSSNRFKFVPGGRAGGAALELVAEALGIRPGAAAHWLEERFVENGQVRPAVLFQSQPPAHQSERPRFGRSDRGPPASPAASSPVAPATPPMTAEQRQAAFFKRMELLAPLALPQVLAKLGFSRTGETDLWQNPDGHQIRVDAGQTSFEDLHRGQKGRSAMDLVAGIKGLRPGAAAYWLEDLFVADGKLKSTAEVAQAPIAYSQMTEDERREAFIKRCEPLETIDVDEVLHALGGRLSHDDKTKWKMPNGNNIWHKRYTQIWKDLTDDKGGSSVVHLVAHHLKIRHGDAARWLEENFTADGRVKEGVITASAPSEAEDRIRGFELPFKSEEHTDDVRRYLVVDRGLPPSLIEAELELGRLYATVRPDRKLLEQIYPHLSEAERDELPFNQVPRVAHCVFSSENGAEIRSVEKYGFKGTATGTDPNSAGYRIRRIDAVKEPVLALAEAAISSLSYRAFFPGRFTFSTNGVARFSLQLELVSEAMHDWDQMDYEGKKVRYGARIAFDADIPGDRGAQRLFNAIYVMHMVANQRRVARLGAAAKAAGMGLKSYLKSLPEDQQQADEEQFLNDLLEVEDGFHSGDLSLHPATSPHELFWGMGLGYRKDLEIHEKPERGSDEEPLRDNEPWKPTGRTSVPVIRLEVNRPVAGFEKGAQTIEVKALAYDYIQHELNFRRDRPPTENDWNDELVQAGPSFVREYERCASVGFTTGNPTLPIALEGLRQAPPRYHVPPSPAAPLPASRGSRFPR